MTHKPDPYDVPDHVPEIQIPLDKVGVDHRTQMISLRGQFPGDPDTVSILCEIELYTTLSSQRRGLHLSRIGEILFSASRKSYESLGVYAMEVAEELRKAQHSNASYVSVRGFYEQEEITPVSKLHTTKTIFLLAQVSCDESMVWPKTGVIVPYLIACPCTQLNFRLEISPMLGRLGLSNEQIDQIVSAMPLMTHSQRGWAKIVIDDLRDTVRATDLVGLVYRATTQSHELLKRPDEVAVVRRAHLNPQFTEDVAREVAREAYAFYRDTLPPDTSLLVRAESEESIHTYNLVATLEITFAELGRLLDNSGLHGPDNAAWS